MFVNNQALSYWTTIQSHWHLRNCLVSLLFSNEKRLILLFNSIVLVKCCSSFLTSKITQKLVHFFDKKIQQKYETCEQKIFSLCYSLGIMSFILYLLSYKSKLMITLSFSLLGAIRSVNIELWTSPTINAVGTSFSTTSALLGSTNTYPVTPVKLYPMVNIQFYLNLSVLTWLISSGIIYIICTFSLKYTNFR